MRFFVLFGLLLACLASSQAQQQQPSGLAVDAYWRTTNIEAWPPGAPTVAENSEKLVAPSAPQQDLRPYGAFQPLLLSAPYYAAYQLPLAYVVQPTTTTAEKADQATKVATTTTERTESSAEESSAEIEKPEKLQVLPAAKTRTTEDLKSDLKSDLGLRSAVSKINPEYIIEEIVPVPGKLVISTSGSPRSAKQQFKKNSSLKLRKQVGGRVAPKVEATGKTSTSSSNFPQIPFGNYFLPYRPEQAKAIQGRKQAALVLEPHSKAVVGNGGTAISTPISKAYLKRGVPTNVYFNPESVAIAGVGGKAHATAELELDLFT
ncbi:uncharacterized protein LOC108100694 isoform X4 [Drosophila ficusphila]|uniref:uncharacterized protein LOC108100694 isoform X4 n=1 Tax=Drosophila ficusphila TaxID=30025 RepID=UPI0007E78B29|nr:uncharacterized protein LOC108100694 isoform X4 [Drosophila ficusphila]